MSPVIPSGNESGIVQHMFVLQAPESFMMTWDLTRYACVCRLVGSIGGIPDVLRLGPPCCRDRISVPNHAQLHIQKVASGVVRLVVCVPNQTLLKDLRHDEMSAASALYLASVAVELLHVALIAACPFRNSAYRGSGSYRLVDEGIRANPKCRLKAYSCDTC